MPMRPEGLTTSAPRGARGVVDASASAAGAVRARPRRLDAAGSVALLLLALAAPSRGATREYFIAAEEVVWDFAPSGQNLVHGGPIPKPYRTKWKKARYIQYTDAPSPPKRRRPHGSASSGRSSARRSGTPSSSTS